MPKREYKQNVDKALGAVQEIAENLEERLDELDKELEKVGELEIRTNHIIDKINMPRSSFYHYTLPQKIDREYEWINYIRNTGKFMIDIQKFSELQKEEESNEDDTGDEPDEN